MAGGQLERMDSYLAGKTRNRAFFNFLAQNVDFGRNKGTYMYVRLTCSFIIALLLLTDSVSAGVNPDGSYSESLPIEVPAGRNGTQPRLALSYNSNASNGIAGVGFSLQGLPTITRMNYGRGIKYDGQDTYAGPEGRLIVLLGGIYHAENESWSKYEPLGSDNLTLNAGNKCGDSACTWRVTDRSGMVYIYGGTNGATVGAVDSAGTALYSGAIRVWALRSITDLSGNYYEVEYYQNSGQFYPKKIVYTLGGGASKHYTVTFSYDQSSRPDKEVSYAQSSFVQTNWRLTEVLVEAQQPIWWIFSWTVQVRRYALGYDTTPGLLVSRVKTWQEFDSANNSKPAVTFDWSNGTDNFQIWSKYFPTGEGLGNYRHYFADVNGDGRTDLIQISVHGYAGFIALAGTDGNFNVWSHSFPTGEGNGNYRHYLADVNGDGRADLIQISVYGNAGFIALAGPDGNFNVWSHSFPTGEGNGNYHHYFADVNGDGRADLIQISVHGYAGFIALAGSDGNFNVWTHGFPTGEGDGNYHHHLADVNGDGRADLIQMSVHGYAGFIALAGTDGNFNVWSHGFPTGEGDGNYSHHFVDVNGDGRADIVQMSRPGNAGYIGLAGPDGNFNIWSNSFPAGEYGGNYRHMFADVNGDGRTDLIQTTVYGSVGWIAFGTAGGNFNVWSQSFPTGEVSGLYRHYMADTNGDGRPDLIQMSITDYNGWIGYDSSRFSNQLISISGPGMPSMSIDYKPAPQLTTPICNGTCPAPDGGNLSVINGTASSAPRYLVTSVKTTSDQNLDNVAGNDTFETRYEYYNGRVATGTVAERASLGFEKIKTTDVNSGNYSITTYRQDKPFQGMPSVSRSYLANGTLISEQIAATPQQYTCDETGCLIDATNNPNPILPKQVRQTAPRITNQYCDGVIVLKREEEALQYDLFGNVLQIRQTLGANSYSKSTYKFLSYTNEVNSTRAVGLPISEKTCLSSFECTAGDTNFISEHRIYYDNGILGTVGSRHLATKKESYITIGINGGVWSAEVYTFDSSGNIVTKTEPNGVMTTNTYDSDYNQFAEAITKTHNGKSLIINTTYDPRFGKKASETDGNGNLTSYKYDATGFITDVTTQNGSTILAKKTFSRSAFGVTPAWLAECVHYGAGFSQSRCGKKFNDSRGRFYREEFLVLVNDVETPMAIERRYDQRDFEVKVSEPFDALSGSPAQWNLKFYDDYGRYSGSQGFDGRTTAVFYEFTNLPTGSISCMINQSANGKLSRACSNIDGKPITMTENYQTTAATTLRYSYDYRGRLISTEAPQGIISIGYLGHTNLQAYIDDPTAGRTDYEYYLNPTEANFSKLKKETHPEPNNSSGTIENNFEYEPVWGRLSKQTKSDGSTVEYFYDETDVLFGRNQLTSIKSVARGYTLVDKFSYSATGSVTATARRISHSLQQLCSNPDDFPCLSVVQNKIDELGRTTEMTYADSLKSVYNYIGGSKQVQAIVHDGTAFATYSGYNKHGKPATLTYGNGVSTHFEYDQSGFMNAYSVISGQNLLLDHEYTFDSVRNITAIADNVLPDFSLIYTYDSLNRLQTAKRGNEPTQNFTFDQSGANGQTQGNLLEKKGRKMIYSAKNRPLSDEIYNKQTLIWESFQSFNWSAAGNLVSRISPNGIASYAYDADNMMKESHDAATGDAEYFYDYSGERFLKIFKRAGEAAIKTWTVNDGVELREKWSPDLTTKHGSQLTKYIYGIDNKRLATATGSAILVSAQIANNYYALASMYSTNSFAGIGAKITYTFYGFTKDEEIHGKMFLLLLLLSTAGLSFYLLRNWDKEDAANGERFSMRRAFALASGLVFISVNINCGVGTSSADKNTVYYANYSVSWASAYDGLPVGTYYYHNTHNDTANLITDSNGNEILRLSYDDYGNIDQFNSGKLNLQTGELDTADENVEYLVTGIKFGSNAYDPETGFYFMHARYYVPDIGVFTTADDFVPGGGTELRTSKAFNYRESQAGYQKSLGQYGGSQGFNRYMFGAGNPVKYSDPTGHAPYEDEPVDINCSDEPYYCTTPWWHNFTGPTNRVDPKGPVEGISFLDDLSKNHDAAGANLCYANKCSEETRQRSIVADITWVVANNITIATGANLGGNIRKAFSSKWYKQTTYDLSKFIERDPWLAPFAAVIYVVASLVAIGAGIFNSIVDSVVVFPIGFALFTANILWNTVVMNPGGTAVGMAIGQALFGGFGAIAGAVLGGSIGKPSFKNFDKPSEWKLPEGEGRLTNYNRPGKWTISKNDWEDFGKSVRCVATFGLWC